MGPCETPSTFTSKIWYPEFGVIVKGIETPRYANWVPGGNIVPPGPAEAVTAKSARGVGVGDGVGVEVGTGVGVDVVAGVGGVVGSGVRVGVAVGVGVDC
jgi:hypothetical protein